MYEGIKRVSCAFTCKCHIAIKTFSFLFILLASLYSGISLKWESPIGANKKNIVCFIEVWPKLKLLQIASKKVNE